MKGWYCAFLNDSCICNCKICILDWLNKSVLQVRDWECTYDLASTSEIFTRTYGTRSTFSSLLLRTTSSVSKSCWICGSVQSYRSEDLWLNPANGSSRIAGWSWECVIFHHFMSNPLPTWIPHYRFLNLCNHCCRMGCYIITFHCLLARGFQV